MKITNFMQARVNLKPEYYSEHSDKAEQEQETSPFCKIVHLAYESTQALIHLKGNRFSFPGGKAASS
jgi:hypothetical protein